LIVFDLHPATTAEPFLALGKVSVEAPEIDGHARGQSLEETRQLGAVRFTGSMEKETSQGG
jgi:hypothetical protein